MGKRGPQPRVSTEALWVDYESGLSLSQVAVRHDLSTARVQQRLKRAGHTLRAARKPTGRGHAVRLERMRAARAAGTSLDDIAKREGLTRQRVHQLVGDIRVGYRRSHLDSGSLGGGQ